MNSTQISMNIRTLAVLQAYSMEMYSEEIPVKLQAVILANVYKCRPIHYEEFHMDLAVYECSPAYFDAVMAEVPDCTREQAKQLVSVHSGELCAGVIMSTIEQLFRWKYCQGLLGVLLNTKSLQRYVEHMYTESQKKAFSRRKDFTKLHEQMCSKTPDLSDKRYGHKSSGRLQKDQRHNYEFMLETVQTIMCHACTGLRLIAPIELKECDKSTRHGIHVGTSWYRMMCMHSGHVYRVMLDSDQLDIVNQYIKINQDARPDERLFVTARISEKSRTWTDLQVHGKTVFKGEQDSEEQIRKINLKYTVNNCVLSACLVTINTFWQLEYAQATHVDPIVQEHAAEKRHRSSVDAETYVDSYFDDVYEKLGPFRQLMLDAERLYPHKADWKLRFEYVNSQRDDNAQVSKSTYFAARQKTFDAVRTLHGITLDKDDRDDIRTNIHNAEDIKATLY